MHKPVTIRVCIKHFMSLFMCTDQCLYQTCNCRLLFCVIVCVHRPVAMCICIKHVIVGFCFVSLLLGTSTRASAPVRMYRAGAGHHFSQSLFLRVV